ncbi:hypothetical protein ABAC402_00480 [Asticcacaulis sp. AC402]|nr:hypothetical protein ABAC402_00480 [Asticcacaulis sp. AC402]
MFTSKWTAITFEARFPPQLLLVQILRIRIISGMELIPDSVQDTDGNGKAYA